MTIALADLLKLFLAVVAGGAIGLERELHHKSAGFRTITLICIGSTIITILSTRIDGTGRIAANIVTGIGFLGAGVILHESSRVKGLTTAATVWLSAALGMGIGSGEYLLSLIATAAVLVVMTVFSRFERLVDGVWDMRHYEISFSQNLEKADVLETQLKACGLRIGAHQCMKRDGLLMFYVDASGATRQQDRFVQGVLADPEIQSVTW
jgi:putative Mg2+ transporter-C (MgtC) family protein